MTTTTQGDYTYFSEIISDNHTEVSLESNGNSSFLLSLLKPTGGDASGSIDLDYAGSGTDEWHIHDKSVNIWVDTHDDLDDVFTSSCKEKRP